MSAQDDSQAVRQLLRIFKPLERLQGVLERAATLEAAHFGLGEVKVDVAKPCP